MHGALGRGRVVKHAADEMIADDDPTDRGE
jgi:hypothetical protein